MKTSTVDAKRAAILAVPQARRAWHALRGALLAAAVYAGVLISPRLCPGGILQYGDQNVLNTGTYSSDPEAGATLIGLLPGAITDANNYYPHGFPFSPDAGDFPGTDQIYVGSQQTGAHDGYSGTSQRIAGPQVLTMDYSSLVPAGQVVDTLTLGIASDDFQFPVFGQPFTATLNGQPAAALTGKLNSLNETGPQVHFFTVGVDPSVLNSSNKLVLNIDEGGDGGDGWAVDFLTVGVTTTPVPEPGTLALFCAAAVAGVGVSVRRTVLSRRGAV